MQPNFHLQQVYTTILKHFLQGFTINRYTIHSNRDYSRLGSVLVKGYTGWAFTMKKKIHILKEPYQQAYIELEAIDINPSF